MFFECQFPRKIAFTASSNWGPTWSTIVNSGFSGFEQRNKNWASTRNKYALGLVARPLAEYHQLLNFFMAVAGRFDAFRFLDDLDFQCSGQPTSPAAGDGNNKIFQLQNTYTIGTGAVARTYTRTLSKPIMSHLTPGGDLMTDFAGNTLADTVVVYLNGVKKTLGTDYTVDATTGLVSFTNAPGVGVLVTADAQYHIPVRFDSDEWPAQLIPSNVAGGQALVTVTGINLVEVRITPGQAQG